MRSHLDYFFTATEYSLTELGNIVYEKVFRKDFSEPGVVVIDYGLNFTSEKLRESMVNLKRQLSDIHVKKVGQKLLYQWMGRFDQQVTTKFHLDNAADQSFLMLGYEPSLIKSKLYFADYVQFYQSINISAAEYFERHNPMFTDGENLLKPYITEIEGFREVTYKIVLMNNSNSSRQVQSIGVFHKAEIIEKDMSQKRVINSTMIYSADLSENEMFTDEQQEDYISTQKIS